jgi:hypothetical protein
LPTSRDDRYLCGVRPILTICSAAIASLTAWLVAGRVLDDRGRQELADRWAEAELCLVGPGLSSGARPSVRMRRIALASRASDDGWPQRCEPAASELDHALDRSGLRAELGEVPSLAAALSLVPDARARVVDTVWEKLRAASLPAGRPGQVTTAPDGDTPRLQHGKLSPLAVDASLSEVLVDRTSSDGTLRLILPGARLCHVEGTTPAPYSRLSCRGLALPVRGEARFAWKQASGPDLLYLRDADGDGFYDAASGQRIWRPRFDRAEASIEGGGATTVLYGEKLGRAKGIDSWRIARLVPGRPPKNRRITVPASARAVLFPDAIAWWESGEDASVWVAGFDGEKPRAPVRVGAWRAPDRLADRCALDGTVAMAFARGDRTLLLARVGGQWHVDEAPLATGTLSCARDSVVWLGTRPGGFTARVCRASGCLPAAGSLPSASIMAVAPLSDQWLFVSGEPGQPARVTVLANDGTTRERLLLDDADHGGIALRGVRLMSGEGRALALLEADGRRLYAVTIDERGEPTALDPRSW